MLYQLTALVRDDDEEVFARDRIAMMSEVVEAPAHRKGVLPRALVGWVERTWLTQWSTGRVAAWKVAAYQPARIGYRDANEFGASQIATTSTLLEFDPDRMFE